LDESTRLPAKQVRTKAIDIADHCTVSDICHTLLHFIVMVLIKGGALRHKSPRILFA
jgi:hypothetical protein